MPSRQPVFLIAFLIACGGGSKPAPKTPPPVTKQDPPPATDNKPSAPPVAAINRDNCKDIPCVLVALEDFTKQMCACKDKTCADQVNDVLTKWGTALADKPELADIKPSPDDAKKMGDVMQKYADCMTKMMMPADGQSGGLGGGVP